MIVGFTGTQEGMTARQLEAFKLSLPPTMKTFIHGCCIGADEEAAYCVHMMLKNSVRIWIYPSNIKSKTSKLVDGFFAAKAAPKPPLDRNKDIVADSELLIACPKEREEVLRSGTWATVRAARKKGIPIIYIWPDGSVTDTRVTNQQEIPPPPSSWEYI
jgi:hypothetical protein